MKFPDKIDDVFMKNVIHAMPRDLISFRKFISLSGITWDNSVATAAMINVGNFRMALNRDFVESVCDSYEHLAVFFVHETLHKVFWTMEDQIKSDLELRGFSSVDPNVLWDVYIQAVTYVLMPEDKYQSVLKKMYVKSPMPIRLLYKGSKFERYKWRTLHRAIFTPKSVDYLRVAEVLHDDYIMKMSSQPDIGQDQGQNLEHSQVPDSAQPLIGDHDNDNNILIPQLGDLLDDIEGKVGQSLSAFNKNEENELLKRAASGQITLESAELKIDTLRQAGYNDSQFSIMTKKAKKAYNKSVALKKMLVRGMVEDIRSKIKAKVKSLLPLQSGLSVIPNYRDRRTVICHELNIWRPYHKNPVNPEALGRCQIYLDVSGSQSSVLPFVVELLRDLRPYINQDVYGFSNKVLKCDIVKREFPGTGGTDFDCVAKHIRDNGVKVAVLFTDGQASAKDPENLKTLKTTKLVVIYTQKNHSKWLNNFTPLTYVLETKKKVEAA